jgi:hypothetical protein
MPVTDVLLGARPPGAAGAADADGTVLSIAARTAVTRTTTVANERERLVELDTVSPPGSANQTHRTSRTSPVAGESGKLV